MTNPLNIKQNIQDWFNEQWEYYVKEPIAKKTEELENKALEQIETYSQKAKETAWKPIDYYTKQEAFYRGLFWIALALLLLLWIISGS